MRRTSKPSSYGMQHAASNFPFRCPLIAILPKSSIDVLKFSRAPRYSSADAGRWVLLRRTRCLHTVPRAARRSRIDVRPSGATDLPRRDGTRPLVDGGWSKAPHRGRERHQAARGSRTDADAGPPRSSGRRPSHAVRDQSGRIATTTLRVPRPSPLRRVTRVDDSGFGQLLYSPQGSRPSSPMPRTSP